MLYPSNLTVGGNMAYPTLEHFEIARKTLQRPADVAEQQKKG